MEEHCRLLPRFPFKADMRLDHEAGPDPFQPIRQLMPFLPFEDQTEMRNGDIVAIDRIAMSVLASLCRSAWGKMCHYLMTAQIEVDPVRIGASFRASENAAVKGTRRN